MCRKGILSDHDLCIQTYRKLNLGNAITIGGRDAI